VKQERTSPFDIKLRPLFGRYGLESGHHRLAMSISAFDPFETWATKDFRSAKACSSRFAMRDIFLSIGWV
jgi:hypothetical protein